MTTATPPLCVPALAAPVNATTAGINLQKYVIVHPRLTLKKLNEMKDTEVNTTQLSFTPEITFIRAKRHCKQLVSNHAGNILGKWVSK